MVRMPPKKLAAIVPGLIALALAACGQVAPPPAAAPSAPSAPNPDTTATDAAATDAAADVRPASALVGRWTGPEGTYLDVARDGAGGYSLEIANLDGPRRFPAREVGDHIEFERDGAQLSLRATDGPGTGMKWLQDKRDCVVVAPGEGFCR